jgi:large subunit ribosomal protein L22
MTTSKATLSNFRQSPRKMRGVAGLVRGKKVSDALVHLDFVAKKASLPIKNLIVSAVANAKSMDIDTENLVVKTITVDAGKTLKRSMPASRGSAHPIHKRTSHITVELAQPVESSKLQVIKTGKNKNKK